MLYHKMRHRLHSPGLQRMERGYDRFVIYLIVKPCADDGLFVKQFKEKLYLDILF